MAYNSNPARRERRLRAYYRKKIWTVAIVMLVIGLIVGFIACAYLVKNNDRVATLLGMNNEPAAVALSTPAPTAEPITVPTEEVIAAPTIAIMQVEPEPTQVSSVLAIMTGEVTVEPVVESTPTPVPTVEPTAEPTVAPTAEPTAEPTVAPTAEPTAVPTAEPTVEPTAVPTAEPTVEPTAVPTVAPVIVPYGEACALKTQIKTDGSARIEADEGAYETLDLTLQVTAYKDQAYYVENYAESFVLQGNEASVEFDITLNNYAGITEIIPQNFLKVSLAGEDTSVVNQGYQLIDAEIQGKTGIVITSDETTTLYKRYPYSPEQGDMAYMIVNTYMDGVEHAYWFEIIAPEPVEVPAEETAANGDALTIGSSGSEVKKLQAKLIELKLLSGQPDGKFGNYTAEAVKILQGRYGMEQTGIADQAFLDKLYG